MESLFEVPRCAVAAFEQTTGLKVGLHDFRGRLVPFLPSDCLYHTSRYCFATKSRHETACVAFDVRYLRRQVPERPEGLIKVCHAGLVEWVVPSYQGDRLDWLLFAGQRVAGKSLSGVLYDPQAATRPRPWSACRPPPTPVEDDEAQRLLELTRQLAARLREWRAGIEETAALPRGPRGPDASARPAAIRRFIQTRHQRPIRLEDLAAFLGLSASRAGHAVRECCGASFVELLNAARLQTAQSLLEHTNLPVLDVASRSGFGDLSHFHSVFRRAHRETPLQYRKRRQTAKV